jgi:hypothetical protein
LEKFTGQGIARATQPGQHPVANQQGIQQAAQPGLELIPPQLTQGGQGELGHGGLGQNARERGHLNFIEVKRQIAEQCLRTAQNEMGAKKGVEFDRAYIGSQIAAHYQMIDTQKVLRDYASPELRKVIDDGIQAAEHHADEAMKIMHSLEGSTGTSAAKGESSR